MGVEFYGMLEEEAYKANWGQGCRGGSVTCEGGGGGGAVVWRWQNLVGLVLGY